MLASYETTTIKSNIFARVKIDSASILRRLKILIFFSFFFKEDRNKVIAKVNNARPIKENVKSQFAGEERAESDKPLDRSPIDARQSRSPTPRRNPKGEFVSLEPLTPPAAAPANRSRYSPTISLYRCPLSFSVPDSMLYDAQYMPVNIMASSVYGPCNAMRVNRSGRFDRSISTCGPLLCFGRPLVLLSSQLTASIN